MFEAGTIAIAIVGGTIGNLGVLGRDMCFPDSVVGVRPSQLTCQDFILLMLLRNSKQPEIQSSYRRYLGDDGSGGNFKLAIYDLDSVV